MDAIASGSITSVSKVNEWIHVKCRKVGIHSELIVTVSISATHARGSGDATNGSVAAANGC